MRLKKRKDLVMLWRMSRFESVREVAQNSDILRLIFVELDPMLQYNRVVREYHDPRYNAHFKRVFNRRPSVGSEKLPIFLQVCEADAIAYVRTRCTLRLAL